MAVESDSSGCLPTLVKAVYPPGRSSRDAGFLLSRLLHHTPHPPMHTPLGVATHARAHPTRVTRHPPGADD